MGDIKLKEEVFMARKGENIHKRYDGRWEARVIIGHDENGKAKYKYLSGKTYTDVRNKKNQYIANSAITKNRVKSKIIFNQLLDDWLFFIEPEIKVSSYARYLFNVNKHIRPELGQLKLTEINSDCIEQFVRNKLENGRLNGEGGLSPKTVNNILSIIKLIIKYGIEKEYDGLTDFSVRNAKQHAPKIQILTEFDQDILEKAALSVEEPYIIGIFLSLYGGLRLGEVCALKWRDICLGSELIQVNKTIMRIQNTDINIKSKTIVVIGEPKTDSSRRNIPIPDFLVEWLTKNKREDDCYVLTGTKKYMEPRLFYTKYKNLLSECGLSKYNYHALRHTFATRCVEKGFDVKSLSEILGHANVNITLSRYVHPTMDMKRKQMNLLSCKAFRGQK